MIRPLAIPLLLLSCSRMAAQPESDRAAPSSAPWGGAEEAPPPAPGRGGGLAKAARERADEDEGAASTRSPAPAVQEAADKEPDRAEAGSPSPARSWFPETFLFVPRLLTDERGRAELSLTVPDRLTTWRVLGLAHDQQGQQAGQVLRFLGTLPVYVDPVLPPYLHAGDALELPIQVVNTTDASWSGPLRVELDGAGQGAWAQELTLPAGGSRVLTVPVRATRSGELRLVARLGQTDAVERRLPVLPLGRLLTQSQGGTLAGPRRVELEGPRDMDPGSARLRLVVFPGALAVLRRELDRPLADTASVAGDARGLLLAGEGEPLLTALGEEVGAEREQALRALGLQAAQRVIRHARAPTVDQAALLLPAVAAHPDNPVLQRLTTRLADQLAREQRPDGTFQGGGGMTVQRMLVATAEATQAVAAARDEGAEPRTARVRLAAGAAFERHQGLVQDPYTAAAILVSGAASAELSEALRAQVRAALVQRADGGRVLPVPEGARRSDGSAPTLAEATALAALALAESPSDGELAADLAGALLGMWRPAQGFGDARADLLGLRAMTTLLRAPLPERVEVVLERDGAPVRQGSLEGARRTELLILDLDGTLALGAHTWTVRAEPPLAGLGFELSLQSHVPWPDPPATAGVEAALRLPPRWQVGQRGIARVELAAPAGSRLEVELALPAGVQADLADLDLLRERGELLSYELEDGRLLLRPVAPRSTRLALDIPLIPTLAGRFGAEALQVRLLDRPDLAFAWPLPTWTVEAPLASR